MHNKVLTFFKGDPEMIKNEFINPPPIKRDISRVIDLENNE